MTTVAKIRPYTSYNLFSQLEREYILQTLLGVWPAIPAEEVFDIDTDESYRGPRPLPPRYADLALPYDWHMPGKAQRRGKRSHRKSHGKIGFRELSVRISEAWRGADDETRRFCVRLSAIGVDKSDKVEKKSGQTKRRQRKETKKSVQKQISDVGGICKDKKDKKDVVYPSQEAPQESPQDSSYPEKIGRTLSHESFLSSFGDGLKVEDLVSQCTVRDSNIRDSLLLTEVDMDDDQIFAIWESIPIEEEDVEDDRTPPTIMCQPCAESSDLTPPS